MKHLKYLLCFVLFCFQIKAQVNLVPNYSFENYSVCPNGNNTSIVYSSFWYNGNVAGTSDYYNNCISTNSVSGIPDNFFGSQYTHTGNAYAGFYAKTIPGTIGQYEYVQAQLKNILKPNFHYCVQFFVSRADKKGDYAISNFGALFTNTLVNSSDPYNIQMIPQVKNQIGNFVIDRTIWSPISGTFTAVGGENYITLGNFDDPNLTDTLYDPLLPDDFIRDPGSIYYYIDDVTVEEVANANAGKDSIIICGDSLVIGADSVIGAYYKWMPDIGLSNDSIAFPIASPTITTTYVLRKQQCSITTYDTVKITVNNNCPVIGINELNNTYHFKLYPNPVDDILYIELDLPTNQTADIIIYNIISELVKSEKINSGKTTINTDNLKSGTYLYKIIIDNNIVKTDKLIIIK